LACLGISSDPLDVCGGSKRWVLGSGVVSPPDTTLAA